jgi:hypothetical protein
MQLITYRGTKPQQNKYGSRKKGRTKSNLRRGLELRRSLTEKSRPRMLKFFGE